MDDGNNVRVCIRVRPLNDMEAERGDETAVAIDDTARHISVTAVNEQRRKLEEHRFAFDHVFGPEATQRDVFHSSGIESYCDAAMEGYASTVFCFGQTGSGKTFTMTGPIDENAEEVVTVETPEQGIQFRAAHYFAHCANEINAAALLGDDGDVEASSSQFAQQSTAVAPGGTPEVVLKASMYEIYNEHVNDLLNETTNLKLRWAANQQGFYVEQLLVVTCETVDDFMAVLDQGLAQRKKASHQLNVDSSRSHVVLTVTAERRRPAPAPASPTTVKSPTTKGAAASKGGKNKGAPPARKGSQQAAPPLIGKVAFVDLAGSEKLRDSGSAGVNATETKNINRSLFALGNVISALAAKSQAAFVPYRDSTLTKLLMDALGGAAKTCMIACVTPSSKYAEESTRTLKYASRAASIVNLPPKARVDPKHQLVFDLRAEIEQLRSENAALKSQLGLDPSLRGPLMIAQPDGSGQPLPNIPAPSGVYKYDDDEVPGQNGGDDVSGQYGDSQYGTHNSPPQAHQVGGQGGGQYSGQGYGHQQQNVNVSPGRTAAPPQARLTGAYAAYEHQQQSHAAHSGGPGGLGGGDGYYCSATDRPNAIDTPPDIPVHLRVQQAGGIPGAARQHAVGGQTNGSIRSHSQPPRVGGGVAPGRAGTGSTPQTPIDGGTGGGYAAMFSANKGTPTGAGRGRGVSPQQGGRGGRGGSRGGAAKAGSVHGDQSRINALLLDDDDAAASGGHLQQPEPPSPTQDSQERQYQQHQQRQQELLAQEEQRRSRVNGWVTGSPATPTSLGSGTGVNGGVQYPQPLTPSSSVPAHMMSMEVAVAAKAQDDNARLRDEVAQLRQMILDSRGNSSSVTGGGTLGGATPPLYQPSSASMTMQSIASSNVPGALSPGGQMYGGGQPYPQQGYQPGSQAYQGQQTPTGLAPVQGGFGGRQPQSTGSAPGSLAPLQPQEWQTAPRPSALAGAGRPPPGNRNMNQQPMQPPVPQQQPQGHQQQQQQQQQHQSQALYPQESLQDSQLQNQSQSQSFGFRAAGPQKSARLGFLQTKPPTVEGEPNEEQAQRQAMLQQMFSQPQ